MIATIECEVEGETGAGDHALSIGRAVALGEDHADRGSFVFHRRRFGQLAADGPAP